MLGAFKATPIRPLETEAYVPPLDLWLNGRTVRFQARLEWTGLAGQIRDACAAIQPQLWAHRRRGRRSQVLANPATARMQWVEQWIGQPIEQWDEREKRKVLKDWTAGWARDQKRTERVVRPGTDSGGASDSP